MTYIDGFVLPIAKNDLDTYKNAAQKIAIIWKEYGALDYAEFISDKSADLEGTRSFGQATNAKEGELVIFGWVKFSSREARDLANEKVSTDPRMQELMAPLVDPDRPIFEAQKMVYGGFHPLVSIKEAAGE